MMETMKEELKGIEAVCYFTQESQFAHVIDMTSKTTVENTGKLWCEAAYGNALIFLHNQKSIDKLYLMPEGFLKKYKAWMMSGEEQRKYLEKNAVSIMTR